MEEKVSLEFREGSSDKEYHAYLRAREGGFVVEAEYGRRGAVSQSASKTPHGPVPYDKAKKLFDALVREKTGKGYQVVARQGGDAVAPLLTPGADKVRSGLSPQLLTPVEEGEIAALIADPGVLMQQKFNGERVLVRVGARVPGEVREITGSNRLGFVRPLPVTIASALDALPHAVVDGELVGERYYLFDLLEFGGKDLRARSYCDRLARLEAARTPLDPQLFPPVYSAKDAADKKRLLQQLRAADAEGVVFKRITAAYVSGRNDDQCKFKFVETATCLVLGINTQRSVALGLLDEHGSEVAVGNVTIPPNHAVPTVGALIEVRYLYAHEGGSLVQPQFQFVRDDVGREAAALDQLKYKPDADAEHALARGAASALGARP